MKKRKKAAKFISIGLLSVTLLTSLMGMPSDIQQVIEEEEKLAIAEELIAEAEVEQSKEKLDEASEYVETLSIPNDDLTERLSKVENDMIEK